MNADIFSAVEILYFSAERISTAGNTSAFASYSGESLPPMWLGFDSRTRRHMWVEFVVSSRPCSESFLSRYSGFPLSSTTSICKFQFDLESVPYCKTHLIISSWNCALHKFTNAFTICRLIPFQLVWRGVKIGLIQLQWNLSLRTPLYYEQFTWSLRD